MKIDSNFSDSISFVDALENGIFEIKSKTSLKKHLVSKELKKDKEAFLQVTAIILDKDS